MSYFTCKNFSEFKEPRDVGEATIYGYCFKKTKLYQDMDRKGYPVYVPEGFCKDHPEVGKQCEGQIDLFKMERD